MIIIIIILTTTTKLNRVNMTIKTNLSSITILILLQYTI